MGNLHTKMLDRTIELQFNDSRKYLTNIKIYEKTNHYRHTFSRLYFPNVGQC